MKLLITQNQSMNQHGVLINSLEKTYISLFQYFGHTLIPVPNFPNMLSGFLDAVSFDGLILSGGNDISIDHPNVKSNSVERDCIESILLTYCIENSLPVLGICRGMQFINCYFGGKLRYLKDLPYCDHHPGTNHVIKMFCFPFNALDFMEDTIVNSYHDWYVTKADVSDKLEVFATNESIIEGIYHSKFKIVGVQWHPERELTLTKLSQHIISNLFM